MVPGVIAVLAGIFLAVTIQFTEPEAQGATTYNPFPPNPDSLAIGQQVFEQNCQVCHGVTGQGDGPAAAGLDPPPANLIVHVPLHSEAELFRAVHDGKSGTAMPSFDEVLADEEIWHLINYIRTFKEKK
jgi:copper transport protein